MCFSINAPITFSWISTEREKQMVLRVNRLMRVRSVRLLRSMRWVNILPARYHRTSLPQSANPLLDVSTMLAFSYRRFSNRKNRLCSCVPEEQTVFLRKALLRCLPELAKQHGTATGITHRFDFRQDNFAVPDILSQTHVDIVHFGHFVACFSGRRFWVFQVTSDRSFRATNLSRNINNIRTLLAHLLYHVKVLSAQHADVLSGVRTSRKQHVGWSGQSKW